MRAHSGRARWKVLSAAKSPNKGRVQEQFLQPSSLLIRTSKHFSPDLKSLHELNPSALFLPPTQKADPGKSKLAHRISPPHPSVSILLSGFFVSLSLCFYRVFRHCISPYMGRCLFLSLYSHILLNPFLLLKRHNAWLSEPIIQAEFRKITR